MALTRETHHAARSMTTPPFISLYWGKARPAANAAQTFHPLAYHMLDVAAVARALLTARPHTRKKAEQLLVMPESAACDLLPLIAALHDLGKFGRAFQNKVPELFAEQLRGVAPQIDEWRRHDADGWLIWSEGGIATVSRAAIWPADQDQILDHWMIASFAHHGRPLSRQTKDFVERAFGPAAGDAREFAAETLRLLLPAPINCDPINEQAALRASNWVAGFVTLCDWIGSSQTWFPYRAPEPELSEYWLEACEKAQRAVMRAGLSAPELALPRSFCRLTGIPEPTPLQQWAESVPLADGPALYIIEDVTGAGKTEAAQMLVHRLMTAGYAGGAYWAMPTQATANAMYSRQAKYISGLFTAGSRPFLALAHGQASLSEPFQSSILTESAQQTGYSNEARDRDDADVSASAACTDFLAHDKRLCLLADVGSGTIDQAILGVLPAKFNTIRLMGLSEKVLVVDEAHAYDAYVQAETEGLLAFQASLGGSAIILSATLPKKKRAQYAAAWRLGLGRSDCGRRARVLLDCNAYPLATVIDRETIREDPIDAAPSSRRDLPVRMIHTEEDAMHAVLSAYAAGGAVAWIRNTVDDALRSAAALREQGAKPLLFHARFAQCDRQAREAEVMRLFGNESTPENRNHILVATQVVEQSLDLDFDCLLTDIAPVDLVLQRAGRFRRHNRKRPEGVPNELLVLAPEPTEKPAVSWIRTFLPGTAAVYDNVNILWRTVNALAREGCVCAPASLRRLVEEVYDPEAEPPRNLERATMRAEGNDSAMRSQGQHNTIRPQDGYISMVHWEEERYLRTRLADKSQTIRLAAINPNGGLVPYASAKTEWKAWALSEIRVRTHRMPESAAPPDRFAAATESIRATWRRFERDIPLLVLETRDAGGFSLAFVSSNGAEGTALYDPQSGLRFSSD